MNIQQSIAELVCVNQKSITLFEKGRKIMKTKVFFAALLVAVFCTATIGYADVPQMINYQGRLTGVGGEPLDTTLSMVFCLYEDSVTTTDLWTETQDPVTVEDGVFSVLLGSVNPIPDSVFDGSVRYLGVRVQGDDEMTPRSPVVSGGYAFRSVFSDTAAHALTGAPDDDWAVHGDTIYHLGNVGIGTSNPAEKLDVEGNIHATGSIFSGNSIGVETADGAGPDRLVASGPIIYVDQESPWGSNTFTGNVKVGIGTPTPSTPLSFGTGLGDKISLWESSGSRYGFGIQPFLLEIYSPSSTSDIAFGYGSSGQLTERVRIKGTGNVGIGTSNPVGKLHVAAVGDAIVIQPNTMLADDVSKLVFNDPDNGTGPMSIEYKDDGNPDLAILGGNVGIGTSNPDAPLHVERENFSETDVKIINPGTSEFAHAELDLRAGTPSGGGQGWIMVGSDNYTHYDGVGGGLHINNPRPKPITLITDEQPRMTITGSGEVGIGTKTPGSRLHVEDLALTSWESALQVDYGSPTDGIPALGILAETDLSNMRGTRIGVRGMSTFDFSGNQGSVDGCLGKVHTYGLQGQVSAVYGGCSPSGLDNESGSTGWALGGYFRALPPTGTSLDLDADGTYYVGGVLGNAAGKVNAGSNAIVAGVIGQDNTDNTGTARSYAGYFDGDVHVSGNVGIGTTNPQGVLDVNSTTGALIVPRMTTAQRAALIAVNGMIIYNLTTNQFNFYENGAWVTK